MFLQPFDVAIVGRCMRHRLRLSNWNKRRLFEPAMRLNVSIRKRNFTHTIMIAPGKIDDPIRILGALAGNIAGVAHIDAKGGVIQAVTPFVEKNKNISWPRYIAALSKDLVFLAIAMKPPAGRNWIHPMIHREIADHVAFIGWTFVNARDLHITRDERLLRINQQRGIRPIEWIRHVTRHPFLEDDQFAIVIVGIHRPTREQLAIVIQALCSLGAQFRFRESRKQQRGKNGDDGNNDQQLDESKGVVSFGTSCHHWRPGPYRRANAFGILKKEPLRRTFASCTKSLASVYCTNLGTLGEVQHCVLSIILLVFLGRVALCAEEIDVPKTLAELNAFYVEPPTNQNAATFYLKAFAALDLTNAYKSDLPWISKTNPIIPGLPIKPAIKTAMQEALLRSASVIDYCKQGATLDKCRYPVDLRQGAATLLPHLSKLNATSRLLTMRGVLLADDGDAAAVTENLLMSLKLVRSLEPEPILISQHIRTTAINYCLGQLEEVLNRNALSEVALQTIDGVIVQMETNERLGIHFRRAIIGEIVNYEHAYDLPVADIVGTVPGWGNNREKAKEDLELSKQNGDSPFAAEGLRQVYTRWIVDYPQRLAIGEWCASRSVEATNRHLIMSQNIFQALATSVFREANAITRLRLGHTAIALEKFRREHHDSYPQFLSELTPRYLNKGTVSPVTAKPVSYRKIGKGYVLQATGYSLKNDWSDKPVQTNLVFSVIKAPANN